MSWIQSHTGRRIELLAPTVDMICLEDIAHALSRICRFTGHSGRHYSVAEHSMLVALLVSERVLGDDLSRLAAVRAALLHDASEAYLGDVSTPLKQLLPFYKRLEERFEEVIALRYGLSSAYSDLIKECDIVALNTERRDLFEPCEHRWANSIEAVAPAARTIPDKGTPNGAKEAFLFCAFTLGIQ